MSSLTSQAFLTVKVRDRRDKSHRSSRRTIVFCCPSWCIDSTHCISNSFRTISNVFRMSIVWSRTPTHRFVVAARWLGQGGLPHLAVLPPRSVRILGRFRHCVLPTPNNADDCGPVGHLRHFRMKRQAGNIHEEGCCSNRGRVAS